MTAKTLDPDIVEAGKRASDIVNTYRMHRTWDELHRKYVAISLADGSSDGNLYDTKAEAVRHQRHEQQCAYICFRHLAGGATPKEMAIVLQFHRDAYNAGMRLVDPDHMTGGPDALITAGQGDYLRARWNNTMREKLSAQIQRFVS